MNVSTENYSCLTPFSATLCGSFFGVERTISMVLQPKAHSSISILDSLEVKSCAELFASSPVETVDKCDEVLCIIQGEVAAANPGAGPTGLGSDSATTCHVVAFRNPTTGRTCLAHLDDHRKVKEAVASMLCLMSDDGDISGAIGGAQAAEEPALDLYVVGGYLGKSCSDKLSQSLLSALDRCRRTFRVVLACMARLNSKSSDVAGGGSCRVPGLPCSQGNEPFVATGGRSVARADPHLVGSSAQGADNGDWLPRQTGLAIDLASGRPYPVRFEGAGRGPGWEVRSSRIFSFSREEALTKVYEPRTDCVVISPFQLFVDPRWLLQMLVLPDHELLAKTSTSPEAEEGRFVADVRAQFSYMLAQSGADGQRWFESVFGAGRGAPLVFPRGAGGKADSVAVARRTPT